MTPHPHTPSSMGRALTLVLLLGLPTSLIASPPAAIDDALYSERRFLGSNVATDVFHLGPGGVARLIYTVGRGPATDYKDVYTGSEQLTYTYTPPTVDAPLVATLTLSGGTLAFDRTRTLIFFNPESHSGTFGGSDSFELRTRQPLTGVANVSNRLWLHPGETNITGFVLDERRLVLIRGIGPTLARFDVPVPASGTSITLYRGTTGLATNTQWGLAGPDAQGMSWVFGLASAFPLDPGTADSALFVSLEPGAYTTHVTTDDPTQRGEALLEVYILPYQ